jgi:hypothetical protein
MMAKGLHGIVLAFQHLHGALGPDLSKDMYCIIAIISNTSISPLCSSTNLDEKNEKC